MDVFMENTEKRDYDTFPDLSGFSLISVAEIAPRTSLWEITGTKKRVTFADLLGFSLVSVIEIAPRNKPKDSVKRPPKKHQVNYQRRCLKCLFDQPEDKDDFLDRVQRQCVCLESVVCDKTIVRGFVRVLNVSYRKDVTIRYTTDGWKTVCDEQANYLSTARDGTTDTFFFRIALPSIWRKGSKMEFAICYSVEGSDYWDNNFFRNYSICCASDESCISTDI